ncbi:conjugal transfer protein TraF [Inmirania thermothiophila]|uniref:F plasmid transfer operon protein TraF n=1 Tax=Inmirania thermothiophila TaxID=1750597 RepID=A0A3N1YBJ2_9GAMM|nr:conjugal transfer protein TraF [Inmirania thermothiophila]ROR34757.1 F plasmid transfer operon protein TraF [Inmirania thermothiophila]
MRGRFVGGTALAGVLVAAAAQAGPFVSFDARSMAMGGTGVATARPEHAPFFNPALMAAAREKDDFGLMAPSLGLRLADPDELADALDDWQDAVDRLDAALAGGDASQVQAAAQETLERTQRIGGRPLQGQGGLAFSVAIPGRLWGGAVYAAGLAAGGGVIEVAAADIDELKDLTDGDPTDAPSFISGDFDPQSAVEARGAVVVEAGVAVARKLQGEQKGWAVGLTPKLQRVETFDYRLDADTADFTVDEGRRSFEDFNLDAGLLGFVGEDWRVGLVVRNLLSHDYTTVRGNQVSVEPQARVGIGRSWRWGHIAADLDLTENDPLGLDGKTQYLAVGAELDLPVLKLRLGVRHNLAAEGDEEETVYSAGFGIEAAVHADLAVAGNSDEIGAAFELGFRF